MSRTEIGKKAAALLMSMVMMLGSIPMNVHGEELQEIQETAEEVVPEEEAEPEEVPETDDGIYHYTQEDPSTILVWKERYIPNGFEDLLNYDDTWWDSLYDYERNFAESLKEQIVELSPCVYDGQELSECIAILESGTSEEEFFAGTVFRGMTLDDLYMMQDLGLTLEDVYEALIYVCSQGSMDGWVREETDGEALQAFSDLIWKLVPNPRLRVSNGDLVANLSVSSTGYKGTSHGTIWKLTVGGKASLCLSKGKSARNGYLYNANPGTYEERNDGLGYLVSRADLSGEYYVCVQIALWLYQQSSSYTKMQVEERAYGMLDESDSVIEPMIATIWNNYYGAIQNSRSYYVLHSDNGNAQNVGTDEMPSAYTYTGGGTGGEGGGEETGSGEYETGSVSASAEDNVEVEASLEITKRDLITDEPLEGAKIVVNGSDHMTDADGKIIHTEYDEKEVSIEGPSYTYVSDWDSLDEEQRADADGKGYYHSRDAAYAASWGEANAQVQEELDDWVDGWETALRASEAVPPYGYTNNGANTYETTAGDGDHRQHTFYNKPWEVWLKVTKYDRITGQTDASLSDAEFTVYEYNRLTGAYDQYRYGDRQVMSDMGDGSYRVGPLYYNGKNQGKFRIMETRSPYGYTIDRNTNCFSFEITGENRIVYQSATYIASQEQPHDFQAYNEPWKVKVDAVKVDEDTKELLSGVRFDILRYNRGTGNYEWETDYAPDHVKVKEQADGTYLSDWVYWNEKNQGKFYLVETEARKGYFGAWKDRLTEWISGHPAGWRGDDADGKEAYYFQITGSRTEEGVVEGYNSQRTLRASSENLGTIANERTKGRVTVVKYDTETENHTTQGDASMNGAVYELRAAEDIIHADGHTGVIFRRGELVRTGTIGEIPGGFTMENLELGSYTLREVKAGDGYMLDETVYHLTFSYDDETQRVVLRDEMSSQDGNTLTVDDRDSGHEKIYTGDYVQKKAFSLIKTSDNQFQTELVPVQGAGFTVYLVSGLKGVREGSLVPANGQTWSEQDIGKFYDYDFTGECPATVYKRNMERWTDGDRKWLQPTEAGANNEYQVKEMFTDGFGKLVSPELPYGTYVVVETTVPANHVMARPFLVEIKEDGGVRYTDDTCREIDRSFTELEDIRYGDHDNADIYREPSAYDADVSEGRVAQNVRHISDRQTEACLRLVKADRQSLPPEGTVLRPEELVEGTVLKEGASYRIRITGMTEREKETFTAAGWKEDGEGYIWYYEPSSRKRYGTADCPFAPTVQRNGDNKIIDCFITLPAKLPTGAYEILEVSAPPGYVRNGQEDMLVDTSTDEAQSYIVTDAPSAPLGFTISNDSVYPDGQMGAHKYILKDAYDNIICTVFQDNQEQKGVLELIKHGEQLYDASDQDGMMLKDRLDDSYFRQIWQSPHFYAKDYKFQYQDAPVAGAVFAVYAAEDIYTQELDSTMLDAYGVDISSYLIYEKDEKIAELTTDKTGYAYLPDIPIGRYYIQEIYAGEGFVRNPEIKTFEISPAEDHVNFEWVGWMYENKRQRIDLKVKKLDAEDGSGVEGAVYGLYTKTDIFSQIMRNPQQEVPAWRHIQHVFEYVRSDTDRVVIPADTLLATAVTDREGYASFDVDLPLGEYYVVELEAPPGYVSTDQIEEIHAGWAGQDTEVQDHTGIVFCNERTKHEFIKSDLESGAMLPGAYLELWEIMLDREGNLRKHTDGSYVLGEEPVDAWISTEDAHRIERLVVGRTYIFRETLSPENYVGYAASSLETKAASQEQNSLTEEVMFVVEDTGSICGHNMKNQRTVGSFSVTKEGEFFVGTEQEVTVIEKVKELFVTVFQYLFGRVKNARFEVYVKEDIFTPDGTGAYAQWTNSSGETLLLKKDTHIETIQTGIDGLATVSGLPLGTYYLRECTAGNGTFLLNKEEKEVLLSYVDQDTPVVFANSTAYINERQKMTITLHKKEQGTNLPLKGAVFGLYAGEDLQGYVVTEERAVSAYPDPLVKKDTLLETAVSDEAGRVVFQADVPSGRYYVRELQAPEGYLGTDEIWQFDASYTGQEGDQVLAFEQDIYNKASDVLVSKQDLTNGKEITGASLEIVEEMSGETVEQWISEETPHHLGRIRISESYEHVYLLREILPAPGYVTAEEIRFVVREEDGIRQVWIDDGSWLHLEDSCIVMKDDITRVEITKTAGDGETLLPGAELELLDAEGRQAASWISSEEPHLLEKLPIGTYTLREVSAPPGYQKAEELIIEVKDTPDMQRYVLKNEKIPNRKKHTHPAESGTPIPETEEVSAPMTGDAEYWMLWLCMGILAAAAVGWIGRRRR